MTRHSPTVRSRAWSSAMMSLALLATCCGTQTAKAEDDAVLIFAAASTGDALDDIAKEYTATTNITVVLSLGASSLMAKQIENGAPADVVLCADESWMDHLDQHHALRAGTRGDLLANHLVLVAPTPEASAQAPAITVDKTFDIAKAWNGRLAIADPTHVPAGIYAQQALTRLGWWEALKDRLAPTLDVRAALRLVETGEAGLGVVYATDALASHRVVVVGRLPDDPEQPIRYPVALTTGAKPAAVGFIAYLRGERASAIFTSHGFELVQQAPPTAPPDPRAAK